MIKIAITIQIIHLLYHQIMTLVDFFPFNGVRFTPLRLRLIEAATNLIPMGIPPIGFLLGNRGLMEAGVVCNFIILAGEIGTWWVPYFFGASPKWIEIYNRIHRGTITILPRRENNPVVMNLEHLILMALTLLTSIITLVAFRRTQGGFSSQVWIPCSIGVVVIAGVVFQCCIAGRSSLKRP